MKILAFKNRQLGDTALWTASIEALSCWAKKNSAELHLMFPKPYADLFTHDPRPSKKILFTEWNRDLLSQLKKENYDWVLGFHVSQSQAKQLRKLSQNRILHHHSRIPNTAFSTVLIPHLGKPMSAIERDLNVVRALGWEGLSPLPKIYFPKQNSLRDQILISPLASRESKQWPLDRFLALIERLPTKPKLLLEKMPEWDSYYLKRLEPYIQLTPTLTALIEELVRGKLWIGNDSGVKHIAAALGTPTLTLFGPESIGEWHGYPLETHRTIQKQVLCRFNDIDDYAWCGEKICPLASHACMNLITIDEVLNETLKAIP